MRRMSSPERISVERLKERGSTWFLVSRLLYVWCLPLLLVLTAAIGLTACQGAF
jgi:hypothetical protein